MPTSFHQVVSLRGFHFENWSLTFNLAAGITAADIGKAVTIDTSAANTMKLAGADDPVVGRLATVEDRAIEGILVGAVELKFANTLPIADGETVVAGNTVVGAGSGEVKAALAADYTDNFVAEVVGTDAIVVKV